MRRTDRVEVDALGLAQLGDPPGVAQDREVAEIAAVDHLGGPQDAGVLALGQHDVLPVRPGRLDELVQEAQGRALGRARQVVYAKCDLSLRDQITAAQRLTVQSPSPG